MSQHNIESIVMKIEQTQAEINEIEGWKDFSLESVKKFF